VKAGQNEYYALKTKAKDHPIADVKRKGSKGTQKALFIKAKCPEGRPQNLKIYVFTYIIFCN